MIPLHGIHGGSIPSGSTMSIRVHDYNYKHYRIDVEQGTLGGEPTFFAYGMAPNLSPASFFDFASTEDEAVERIRDKIDKYGGKVRTRYNLIPVARGDSLVWR